MDVASGASYGLPPNLQLSYRLPSSIISRYLDSLTSPGHERHQHHRLPLSQLSFAPWLHMPQESEDDLIPRLRCCCGNSNCAFLAHSSQLLEKVKRDARTAGELGQVRFVLHLIYIARIALLRLAVEQAAHISLQLLIQRYELSNLRVAGAPRAPRNLRCRRRARSQASPSGDGRARARQATPRAEE